VSAARRALRQIGLFTSGRQDTGYLLPVARAIERQAATRATIFLSGTHLKPGEKVDTPFHAEGFRCVPVSMLPAERRDWDGQINAKHIAELCREFAEALTENPVDVVVLLGDRIETLAAAVVAVADRRFLAHIHGGDKAPGVYDDANRHAITKLAHVHFAATAGSAARLVRLGEVAETIHQVGSPGIDSIVCNDLPGGDDARLAVNLSAGEPFVLLLHHPAGLGREQEAAEIHEICQGVFKAGLTAVCLGPNADPHRDVIWQALRHFSSVHNWPIHETIDRRVFLALMREATALVGNSSAGMVESAAVDAVVLDVGSRQRGREHSANVIHVSAERRAVERTLLRLMSDKAYAASLRSAKCVFGDGLAARRIASVLAEMELSEQRRTKLISY